MCGVACCGERTDAFSLRRIVINYRFINVGHWAEQLCYVQTQLEQHAAATFDEPHGTSAARGPRLHKQ